MKKKSPSNPSTQAESLNQSLNAGTAQEQTSPSNSKLKRAPQRTAKRKFLRTKQPDSTASRANSESKRNQFKARLAAKIAQVDKEKLHDVLLGCGVAVGIGASVVLAIKLMPLAMLILAFLGLALALRLWGLLPMLARPF